MCSGNGILHFGLLGKFLMGLEDYAELKVAYYGMLMCAMRAGR